MPHGLDGLLLEVEDVLVDQAGVIPGALEAIVRLRAAGIPFRLLTNLSRISPAEISLRLAAHGFSIDPEEIWSPPRLAARRLALRPVGTAGPVLRFVAEGCMPESPQEPSVEADASMGCLLVGDAGRAPDADELKRIARALESGWDVWVMSPRPDPGILGIEPHPGLSEFLESVASSGRGGTVLGKPSSAAFEAARSDLGLWVDSRVAMVGTDSDGDLAAASGAGLATVRILSRRTPSALSATGIEAPDFQAEDFGTFVHRWLRIR